MLARMFPTQYKYERGGFRHPAKSLQEYTFDLIPLPVLNAWRDAYARRLFSAFEIWTAEAIHQPDPVLIGRRSEHPFVYVLARWGETLGTWNGLAKQLGLGSSAKLPR